MYKGKFALTEKGKDRLERCSKRFFEPSAGFIVRDQWAILTHIDEEGELPPEDHPHMRSEALFLWYHGYLEKVER